MSNEQEMQEKYMQFQMMLQQSQHIEQALEALNKQTEELNNLKQNLEEISKVEEGNELLVPLGAGIFLKANLAGDKDLLMNVGSKVVVKKSPEEAMGIIDKQLEEINKAVEETVKEQIRLTGEQQSLQGEIQELIEAQES
tara:strand:- start:1748 stop:2167 length:420 start_codon:yes stop_codon:yes gene_type:complete